MPPLRIPPGYQAGISAIAALNEAEVDQLERSLGETHDRLATERLALDVEAAVPSLDGGAATEVIEALLSLIALLDEDGEVEQLANDVAQSRDLELEENDREELARRLSRLLQLPSLALAARALDIATEHERAFHDARVVTDIRPVFGPSVPAGPRGALISAMLKIEFHPYGTQGSVEAEFFALDRADLIRLREVVDRALEKIGSLEQLVASANLPYWEYRDVEEPADATDS